MHESSAVLDPYSDVEEDETTDARIEAWLSHVRKEMCAHRSPFVAAEVLFRSMEEQTIGIEQPDRLYLATALSVLDHCVPVLSDQFRDLTSAAMQELIPAIMYTRTVRGEGEVEVTRRSLYAKGFARLYCLFLSHRHRTEVNEHRAAVGRRVIDRVIRRLDLMWMRRCLRAWFVYCRDLRNKKLLFRQLVRRGEASHFMPTHIRAWRQYAHSIMMHAKIQRSVAVIKKLEDLYPLEQAAKSQMERAGQECQEAMRLYEEAQSMRDKAKLRLDALEKLHAETEESLQSHWNMWQRMMECIFDDTHPLPEAVELDVRVNRVYPQNITDTATMFSKRAKECTGRLGLPQIHTLLASQGIAQHPPLGLMHAEGKYILIPDPVPKAEDLVAMVGHTCMPVVSPMHRLAVLYNDVGSHNVTFHFLMCRYAGGHCSLFDTPIAPFTGQAAENQTDTLCAPPPPAKAGGGFAPFPPHLLPMACFESELSSAGKTEPPPVDLGQRLVMDIADGMERLQSCLESNEQYLLNVRHFLQVNEMEALNDFLAASFAHWSAAGVPIDRSKIESVTQGMVSPGERPVIAALYPAEGIHSFQELVSYLTKLSEFTSWPLMSIAERLTAHYLLDPIEDTVLALEEEEVAQFLRENVDHIARLFDWIVDDEAPHMVSWSKTLVLLKNRLNLSFDEAQQVWSATGLNKTKVSKDEMDQFLYHIACCVDPSPFASTVEKLGKLLDLCLPFLLGL